MARWTPIALVESGNNSIIGGMLDPPIASPGFCIGGFQVFGKKVQLQVCLNTGIVLELASIMDVM